MKCSKCGKEIKEGNGFCTYCGTPVNKIEDNKNILQKETEKVKGAKDNNINVQNKAKNKSNKMKIIIPIVLVAFIIICITVVIILRNKTNEATNTNEIVKEQQEIAKIEIGTNYNCVEDSVTGYINFNTETSYVMNMTYEMSESVTYNGTYKIEGNTITLTVTYYDMADNPETFEPYTETINILEDGTLKYTSSGATYIFDKNITLKENNSTDTEITTTGDLLEQIYAKYPSLESKEGIVCTDGIDYWLLDETGDKVYFTDLTSFEEALKECNINVNDIKNSNKTKIDMEKFVKELSYGSTSTVNNANYPGDGYRIDYFYYDEDLTLDDFSKTQEGDNITYSLTTTKTRSVNYNFPITLDIIVGKNDELKEIKIIAKPNEWKAKEILGCSSEVETALGYTIYNQYTSESDEIVKAIKEDMISYDYIESIGEYKINVTNKTITKEDTKHNRTITFTIGTDTLTYDIVF